MTVGRHGTRLVVAVAIAALVLAASSTLAVGAVSGAFRSNRTAPNGRCTAPALPGTVVDVRLMNMGGPMMNGRVAPMMGWAGGTMRVVLSRQQVPSGTVSLRVANVGSLLHELVVLPLAIGARIGEHTVGVDGTVDETGSVGEASHSCGAGSGGGIEPGAISWVTLTLAPGDYELICNLAGHYAAGMYAGLHVG